MQEFVLVQGKEWLKKNKKQKNKKQVEEQMAG